MDRKWILMACLALLLALSTAAGQPSSDNWACLQDCEFRYGIKRDAWGGGAVMLPSDTPHRIAYLECVETCNKKSWPSFGDQNR